MSTPPPAQIIAKCATQRPPNCPILRTTPDPALTPATIVLAQVALLP